MISLERRHACAACMRGSGTATHCAGHARCLGCRPWGAGASPGRSGSTREAGPAAAPYPTLPGRHLVGDDALLDGFAQRHGLRQLLRAHLQLPTEQQRRHVRHRCKLWVALRAARTRLSGAATARTSFVCGLSFWLTCVTLSGAATPGLRQAGRPDWQRHAPRAMQTAAPMCVPSPGPRPRALSLGLQKCSISACVNSRTRSRPARGAISLRYDCPICAAANGSLLPL